MAISARGGVPVLLLDNLCLFYGSDSFSLSVNEGDALSLMGGEPGVLSRLCDILAGFRSPVQGRILIAGEDITTSAPERRPIALVSPRDPVFGHLDVADNIAFPLRVQGAATDTIRSRTARVMALTGLEALATTRADRLTPEQDLRLKLARALAYAPRVLVLDDVLSGLDFRGAAKARQLLSNLQRALGLSMVYAARGREDAVWLGGRIALFDRETLVQCADAATLLERPSDARSAGLFGEANLLTGHVLSIDDDVARIHLACGGVVEAMADEALEADSLCTLCVRPDRMTPLFGTSIAGDDETPPLMASIQSVLHTGDQIRLRLRLADGAEIDMRRPLLQSTRVIKPGATLQLAWQASQAVAFPMKDDL
ncbi:ABC transporter ATP-binding protein [Asaia krungthepensis]|uniref:Spermidine/putrescine ABC transporter ATP-binding protein n=1 Tax=Asaia krungthepensis NRIC 0535 TaxID=1307925 RepID=A0ABQ0Q6Y9_9PROT|nr:ABC transporter ATP-binding protein [Asaia krungthepensis]GBQ94119.1 spermidine/putrescine ABC transporter ATP-binding protein [Asaia krungthepensis NRIC 0535]